MTMLSFRVDDEEAKGVFGPHRDYLALRAKDHAFSIALSVLLFSDNLDLSWACSAQIWTDKLPL